MDPLFLTHPQGLLALDLTRAFLHVPDLDALPWSTAFSAMEALEAGAIANRDEDRQVGHYWLRDPTRAPSVALAERIGHTRDTVIGFAEEIRSGTIRAPDGDPFTCVLHIGIGGSALGPQLLVDALGDRGLPVHFIDNLDPDGVRRILDRIGDDLGHTLTVVVSKSGGTPETANALTLVCRAMEARGFRPAAQLVAITGEGSALDRRAEQERWLARFAMWDWVGGRTSITSAVGLLPGALAGVDMAAFLEGAAAMDRWTRTPSWRDNPAALLAGAWHLLGKGRGDRSMVVLPYSDRLLLFGRYLQQLVMESLGKAHDRRGGLVRQGLTVFGNKGSTDQHSFVQQLRDGRDDFFALLVAVLGDGHGSSEPVQDEANAGDLLQGFLLGTRRALAENNRPTITLAIPRVDATTLGASVALFERAVGLYAELIGINAYHQPGVEAGKRAARAILALQAQVRALLGPHPRGLSEIAASTGADPVEVWQILARLEHTGRARRVGDGWCAP